MVTIVVYPIGSWAGFHRRPMLEALARNLEEQAQFIIAQSPVAPQGALLRGDWRETGKLLLRPLEQHASNIWVLRTTLLPGQAPLQALRNGVRRAMRHLPTAECTVAFVFRPHQLPYIGLADEDYVVYECYDEYREERPDGQLDEAVVLQERELMSRAAMVLTTSLPLYDSRRREHNNVVYAPNGVDTRLFGRALGELTVPSDMADVCHPIVGYVGNVAWWLDCDVLETVVDAMSDTEFVFIGPISCQQVVDRLSTPANVRFLGLKPRHTLPAYLRQFDVTLCPFRTDNYFQCARPLKILEYLSAGKPVVTTPLQAVSDLADVLYLASSADETIAALKKALSEASDPELISKRVQRAAENDWDVLTKRTAEAILDLCTA